MNKVHDIIFRGEFGTVGAALERVPSDKLSAVYNWKYNASKTTYDAVNNAFSHVT